MARRALAVGFACGCLALAACGRSPEPDPAGGLITLKASYRPFLTYSPFHIAMEEGFFAEQGLRMKLISFNQDAYAIPPLARGELDVVGSILRPGFLNAIAGGSNIRIVADRGHVAEEGCSNTVVLASREAAESGALEDPARLRTLRLGTQRGTANAYLMDRLLTARGLSLDDFDWISASGTVRAAVMQSGDLDLAALGEPWVTRLLRTGDVVSWAGASEVIPGFQYTFVTFGPSLLEERPEVGRRFMVAYLKGVRRYNEGKTPRNLDILARHTQLDRDLIGEACWPRMRDDGHVNVESVMDFQQWARERGFVDAVLEPEQFWDPRFVEHANRVLAGEGEAGP